MDRDNLLRDALYNVHPKSGASTQYGRGIVVGIIAVLMANGMEFNAALKRVCNLCPLKARIACFPEEWRGEVNRIMAYTGTELI